MVGLFDFFAAGSCFFARVPLSSSVRTSAVFDAHNDGDARAALTYSISSFIGIACVCSRLHSVSDGSLKW